ncbi:kinase-like protein [Gigaspora margarita]|uniref:Kinase-like protein n=1 Tax=Gigaspora margarita TaxID=4874 RepID=A0A8H3X4X6_GIGMA|nr:kinase-like protein [Gigaspora margarita]
MVPNKVLRLFSKKQEDNVDHSYIRKPHKVEWTKPHETKESNHRTRPLIPARFDDFDPSGNGKRHRSTPLSVDPRRYPAIGYDHRRNNSSDYKWNYSERTLVDKQFNANFGKEQYMNETFKKNYYYKTDYQQISPTLNPNAYTIINSDSKPILNSNSKPIVNNESILNIDENAKPIVNNTKTKPIMIVNAKHQNAKYSQTNQQTFEPLSPNSKQTLTSILDTTIKSKDDQYSDFLPGTCPTCKGPIPEAGYYTQWCSACQSKLFEKKFGSWSSGNDDIDMFILETQLSSPSRFDYLEWIPFDKFKEVRFVGSGGYGNVYHAIWLDGPREKWDAKTVRYIRRSKQNVVLRSFNNLNIGSELFAEVCTLKYIKKNS